MRPGQAPTGFIESFGCAARGVATAFRRGRNIRVQATVAAVAAALGLALRIAAWEWVAIVICIGCVLGAEAANSAIEDVVDLASPEYHELAKSAKDMAAGGVLVLSVASLVVGLVVFLPKMLAAIGGAAL